MARLRQLLKQLQAVRCRKTKGLFIFTETIDYVSQTTPTKMIENILGHGHSDLRAQPASYEDRIEVFSKFL